MGLAFSPVGEPPSDVQSLRTSAAVLTSVFLSLSTTTLILRFIVRWKLQSGLEVDDCLIAISYFISLEPAICIYLLLRFGLGYHATNIPESTYVSWLKTYFALQRANQIAFFFIKSSILWFYIRIFDTKMFRRVAWANMIYTFLWAAITWGINLASCHPVAYFWDKTIANGVCHSQTITGSVSGALGALGDVLILCLPLFMIRKLQLSGRRKFAVGAVFILGAFTCIASIVRLTEVFKAVPSDLPHTNAKAAAWTAVEMQVGIMSANLPTLAPLFDYIFRDRKLPTSLPSNYAAYSHGSSGTSASYQKTRASRSLGKAYDDFERISDEGLPAIPSKSDDAPDLRVEDQKILVKTEYSTRTETASSLEVYEMGNMKVNGWNASGLSALR